MITSRTNGVNNFCGNMYNETNIYQTLENRVQSVEPLKDAIDKRISQKKQTRPRKLLHEVQTAGTIRKLVITVLKPAGGRGKMIHQSMVNQHELLYLKDVVSGTFRK